MFFRTTIAARFAAGGNRPSGFDYLRLFLALCIVIYHSVELSHGWVPEAQIDSAWRAPVAALLPMFFGLSGFLVAGSLERAQRIGPFVLFRMFRIFPALMVETILSALVLGPLVTAFPWRVYFSSPDFYAYFGNMVGHIRYLLPGVFLNNPLPQIVNLQLWTVPFELVCYLLLVGLSLTGLFRERVWLVAILLMLHGLQLVSPELHAHNATFVVQDLTLITSFLSGLILYRYRERVPWHPALGLCCAALAWLLLRTPWSDAFAAMPLAYVTVWLGLMNPPRWKLLLGGDYSYGMFLYSCVIQQTMMSQLPPQQQEWYWLLGLSMPCIVAFAAGSWWLVERPMLSLRHRFAVQISRREG